MQYKTGHRFILKTVVAELRREISLTYWGKLFRKKLEWLIIENYLNLIF